MKCQQITNEAVVLAYTGRNCSFFSFGQRVGGIDIYVAIANTFGVTLDYLLGEDEEDKPKEAAKMRVRIAMSLLRDVEKLLDEA